MPQSNKNFLPAPSTNILEPVTVLVAPKKVCVTNQITPVPQPVICPIECRRVNHCMYYPVFYPAYEQTFVNASMNSLF